MTSLIAEHIGDSFFLTCSYISWNGDSPVTGECEHDGDSKGPSALRRAGRAERNASPNLIFHSEIFDWQYCNVTVKGDCGWTLSLTINRIVDLFTLRSLLKRVSLLIVAFALLRKNHHSKVVLMVT